MWLRDYNDSETETTLMNQNRFPQGWDEARVKRVLEHYESQSDDEAIAIASRHPMARFGSIELRPFWPIDVEEDPRARAAREADG